MFSGGIKLRLCLTVRLRQNVQGDQLAVLLRQLFSLVRNRRLLRADGVVRIAEPPRLHAERGQQEKSESYYEQYPPHASAPLRHQAISR